MILIWRVIRKIWVYKLIKKLIRWNAIWPYENKLDSFNFADIDILVGNTFVTCFLTKLTPSALCTITLWSKKIINHMRINIGSKFYPVIVGCKILSMLWKCTNVNSGLTRNKLRGTYNVTNTLFCTCRFGLT